MMKNMTLNPDAFGQWTVYEPHKTGKSSPTCLQLGLLWVWIIALFLYLTRFTKRNKTSREEAILDEHNQKVSVQDVESCKDKSNFNQTKDSLVQVDSKEQASTSIPDNKSSKAASGKEDIPRFSSIKPPPCLNEFLLHILQLGIILLFFYYSDYVKVFPKSEKIYSRDTFLFLVFLLFLVGMAFTIRPTADKILNRDITEEWKGWMQVMFVWYHYFNASEWYNWIRIYIACYVWMTGFGNFSFFWIRKDFSVWRALKMLFRLNFLVLLLCATVSNPYMLYYICAMHTYWFLSVYALMGILPSWNHHRWKMIIKFAVYAIINSIIFDIPGMSDILFKPLWPFLGYQDGKYPIMHEWSFRCGLDHWVCFIGMVCAYNYPYFEAFMKHIEQRYTIFAERRKELILKALISLPILIIYLMWHGFILGPLEKITYNSLHPYTSFIPILAFIWFRNLFPILRTHYIHMFAELGKITLETYLAQLHAYLQSNAKELIIYIDGYPLLNFSFNTIIYLAISHTLFSLTSDFSAYLLPKDTKLLCWRLACLVIGLVVAAALGVFSKYYLVVLIPYL